MHSFRRGANRAMAEAMLAPPPANQVVKACGLWSRPMRAVPFGRCDTGPDGEWQIVTVAFAEETAPWVWLEFRASVRPPISLFPPEVTFPAARERYAEVRDLTARRLG